MIADYDGAGERTGSVTDLATDILADNYDTFDLRAEELTSTSSLTTVSTVSTVSDSSNNETHMSMISDPKVNFVSNSTKSMTDMSMDMI